MKIFSCLTFALLLCAAACSSPDADQPAPSPAPAPDAPAPAPDPAALGPTGPDGLLRAEAVTVFAAPLPVQSQSVAVGSGWAGYQSAHSYREVTSFYRKKLGEDFQAVQRSGGTRFSSEDGLTDIYVPIPRRPGDPVRVFYFNRAEGANAPPVVGQRPAPAAPPVAAEAPAADTPAPSLYDEQVTTDAQGRKVIIYQPKPQRADAGATGQRGVSGAAAPPKGPYRSVRIPIPEGVLD